MSRSMFSFRNPMISCLRRSADMQVPDHALWAFNMSVWIQPQNSSSQSLAAFHGGSDERHGCTFEKVSDGCVIPGLRFAARG